MNRTHLASFALVAFSAAGLVSSPVLAAPRALSADEHTALRCGAAFAMVAAGQAKGEAAAKKYPPMGERGREYFVRLTARLMDDATLDPAGIKAAARAEVEGLRRSGGPAPVMPFCLKLLDAQPAFTR